MRRIAGDLSASTPAQRRTRYQGEMKETMRVLLIEDNPGDGKRIRDELQAGVVEVTVRGTVAAAVLALSEFSFDAVLLDLGPLDSHDFQDFERVHRAAGETPVLILSGRQDLNLAARYMAAGADDYLLRDSRHPLALALVNSAGRAAARRALAQSHANLRALVSDNYNAMVVLSAGGDVRFSNPAASRLFGERICEGKYFGIPSQDGAQELDVARSDGTMATVEMRVSPSRWNGEPAHVLTFSDVTERHEASLRIAHLNRILRTIRTIDRLIVHEHDPHALIDQSVKLLVEHCGYDAAWLIASDEAGGRQIAQSGWRDRIAEFAGSLSEGGWPGCHTRALASPSGFQVIEPYRECGACPLRAGYGETDLAMVCVLRHKGRVLGLIGVSAASGQHISSEERELLLDLAADIAFALQSLEAERLRQHFQEELSQLNATLETRVAERTHELEEAYRELEAFSYSISHDLRNPLRAMDGFSQALLEDYAADLPTGAQRYLRSVREGALRMAKLIDGLLTFSRLSRKPLAKRNVIVTRLIGECLEELRPETANRSIDIRTGSLPDCLGDTSLLRQVWLNLLSNAIKYSRGRDPAIIELGSLERDGEIVYFIGDNGAGFDMRFSGKLFGVFERLHRPDEFEGTGVGLAIAQRIVRRHGGRIWAEAEVGRGARFFFTLGKETSS